MGEVERDLREYGLGEEIDVLTPRLRELVPGITDEQIAGIVDLYYFDYCDSCHRLDSGGKCCNCMRDE